MGKNKKRAARGGALANMSSPKYERRLIRNDYNKNKPKKSTNFIPSDHLKKITERRLQIPKVHRANYDKAMKGRSLKAAVKAFCLECVCWQKEDVKLCSSPQCSLYPYRPYRSSKKASESADFTQDCKQG
ncbi:MAG: hypothetical protein ACYSSP_10605 [Planctomycetota bacterium]|jgi:hypothetical protein